VLLTSLSIKRPLVLLVLLGVLIAGGIVGYTRMGVDLLPDVPFPIVAITTIYPGAGPDEVDAQVTGKIEDAISGMSDIDHVDSTSVEGTSVVVVYFTDHAASDSAAEVERRVSSIRGDLPSDVVTPTIGKFDPSATPILSLALSGRNLADLQVLAEDRIQQRLQNVDGVATVKLIGGLEREIQVQVDPEALQARGLSLLQVNQALAADNVSVPAGMITQRGQDVMLRLNAQAQSPDDLGDVLVAQTPNGPVRLQDVATIVDTFKKPTTIQRVDGLPAVGITVQKDTDANTVATAEAVKSTIQQLNRELPAGAKLSVITDSSVFTRQSIGDVMRELGLAVVLTGIVLLFFLHTLRSTSIVLLSIPTSLVATLGAMYVLGLTLNVISLMALTLTVGILVDDSIVVLENIFRHLELGETPWHAALKGRSEIGLAAIAITAVDVVVFLPLAFMTGPVGGYFRQFGLVVSVATVFSLLMSFTLTPMLASRWYRRRSYAANGQHASANGHQPRPSRNPLALLGRAWDASYSLLAYGYSRALGASLHVRWLVLLLGLGACALGLWLLLSGRLATEYAPDPDNSQFIITLEMPPGTSLDSTNQMAQIVEQRLHAWPEVLDVFSSVGVGGSGQLDLNRARFATLQVNLVPRAERNATPGQLANKAHVLAADLTGVTLRANPVGLLGQGRPTEIDVTVLGDDQDTLTRVAGQVATILKQTPGLDDVTDGGITGQPELVATIDHARAADVGLTPGQVAGVLRTGLTGSTVSTFRPEGTRGWDITVVLDPATTAGGTDHVGDIPIVPPRGGAVTLSQVADITSESGPTTIVRQNRQRAVTATASLNGERPLGDISRDLRTALAGINLPPGFSIELGGAAQRQTDVFTQVGQALTLSVILMYALLVLLYSSWLYPIVRMLSLPLGILGAFGLLWITGHTLNIMSLIGLILCEGLVGKNAILLIDYTNTLQRRGMDRTAALIEAGRTRLRPILMTSLTIILAMLPVAYSLGEGNEWRVPMAITVIGGLLSSTLLALFFIPSAYTVLDDVQRLFGRAFGMRTTPSLALDYPTMLANGSLEESAAPRSVSIGGGD
jgi:HAE1 family hydrophobic/amphiphilic exporter-1